MGIIKYGVDHELEEQADKLLAESRRGITKHSQMKDFLSPSQLERREAREIGNRNGFPESYLFHGMAKRAYVPGREKGPRDLRLEARSREEVEGLSSEEVRRRLDDKQV